MIWEDEEYVVSLRRDFGSACQGAGVKDYHYVLKANGTANEPTNNPDNKQSIKTTKKHSEQRTNNPTDNQ